jgi:hypothetical protein
MKAMIAPNIVPNIAPPIPYTSGRIMIIAPIDPPPNSNGVSCANGDAGDTLMIKPMNSATKRPPIKPVTALKKKLTFTKGQTDTVFSS